ncbi:hypothetical protein [Alteribacter natronophilus]|uniref:hypothetical protein n=1 Tax=Alteribacter natronophilus TaxID=2583810 RepID=UPI00110F5490|nr:hypothetical protein [Alteribacter natronophilus]TMW72385.1 hypothetical protein FGB90_09275 [Alteribacter natronophilus]
MTARLDRAQLAFLNNYAELLGELDDVLAYVSECYIKDDYEIGDRLLADVMKGMLPYHPENLTIVSIFGQEEEALETLGCFHEAAQQGADAGNLEDPGERMHLLHEVLIVRYKLWYSVVKKKKSEMESSG